MLIGILEPEVVTEILDLEVVTEILDLEVATEILDLEVATEILDLEVVTEILDPEVVIGFMEEEATIENTVQETVTEKLEADPMTMQDPTTTPKTRNVASTTNPMTSHPLKPNNPKYSLSPANRNPTPSLVSLKRKHLSKRRKNVLPKNLRNDAKPNSSLKGNEKSRRRRPVRKAETSSQHSWENTRGKPWRSGRGKMPNYCPIWRNSPWSFSPPCHLTQSAHGQSPMRMGRVSWFCARMIPPRRRRCCLRSRSIVRIRAVPRWSPGRGWCRQCLGVCTNTIWRMQRHSQNGRKMRKRRMRRAK